jgi:hypothetical protein
MSAFGIRLRLQQQRVPETGCTLQPWMYINFSGQTQQSRFLLDKGNTARLQNVVFIRPDKRLWKASNINISLIRYLLNKISHLTLTYI